MRFGVIRRLAYHKEDSWMPTMEDGATKGRPTRWADKTTRQHLRQFFLLGLEGYSAKGEGNAAAHRAIKKTTFDA